MPCTDWAVMLHREDDAVVLGADEVAQQDVADRALLVGGADDGDAPGVEHFVEVERAHAPVPWSEVGLLGERCVYSTPSRRVLHPPV